MPVERAERGEGEGAESAGVPAAFAAPVAAGPRVLAIDVGGTHVRLCVQGQEEVRKRSTGRSFGPEELISAVQRLTADWEYDAIAIGFPAPIVDGRPAGEPVNLAPGWAGFDLARALGAPTRVMNDAALQALGSYRGGKMLFLGLGTGLGTALVSGGRVQPTELAHLPYKKGRSYEDYLGKRGLARLGVRKWRKAALDVIERLAHALQVDSVVVGGGNAAKLGPLPEGVRLGHSALAFEGGFRLWGDGAPGVGLGARLAGADPDETAVRAAARRAAQWVEPGMCVGFGAGPAVDHVLRALAERAIGVRAVVTRERTHALAAELGLAPIPLEEAGELDLAIAAAGAVDASLNLILTGGAHAREKIVARMARRFIAIADCSALVEDFAGVALPVEVLQFGAAAAVRWLRELGADCVTRRAAPSDSGNLLMDVRFPRPGDPLQLSQRLAALPGLVDHGLFEAEGVECVLAASPRRVRELRPADRRGLAPRPSPVRARTRRRSRPAAPGPAAQ